MLQPMEGTAAFLTHIETASFPLQMNYLNDERCQLVEIERFVMGIATEIFFKDGVLFMKAI